MVGAGEMVEEIEAGGGVDLESTDALIYWRSGLGM